MEYIDKENTGLPTNFNIVDGKFSLVGGKAKCQDNMRMILYFIDWYREYRQGFCLQVGWMLQKPTSYIETFKNVYLLQILDIGKDYAQNIQIEKTALNYDMTRNNKSLIIGVEFSYRLNPRETLQQVIQISQ